MVNSIIVLTYVDDSILVRPSMVYTNSFVQSMKNGTDKFVLTDEGNINNFLGIEFTQIDEKIFKLSQLFLIEMIVSLLNTETKNYGMETNTKSTPVGNSLSHKYLSGNRAKRHGTNEQHLGC